MFYSHEILTSRKYGVATVWLVATLGAKSSAKKVTRKAITGVDVQKACETIIEPEAPMALRLQSNLMYGVTRVYSQQCTYVLNDAVAAQTAMRAMLKSRGGQLDSSAGKAKPEQLILADDPAFLPDMALPALPPLEFDVSRMSLEPEDGGRSQSMMSVRGRSGSISSGSLPPLNLGSSSGNSIAYQLPFDNPFGGSSQKPYIGEDGGVFGEEMMYEDDIFDIDGDGNLLDIPESVRAARRASAHPQGRLGSDSAASGRVRREHEEAAGHILPILDGEGDFGMFDYGDDDMALPDAEAFPVDGVYMSGALQGNDKSLHGNLADRVHSPAPSSDLLSSISADAPLRKKRKAKGKKNLASDQLVELRNGDLIAFRDNYVANMAVASRVKVNHKAGLQAKKNAFHYVYGNGLLGVGDGLGFMKLAYPLNMFAGENLLSLITGNPIVSPVKRSKRDREEQEQDQESSKRARLEEDEVGRGHGFENDDHVFDFGDDFNHDASSSGVEIGRDAQSALPDLPSSALMPWNVSASLRGSNKGATSLASKRLMSASPLIGRGSALPDQFLDADDEIMYGRDDELSQSAGVGRAPSSSHAHGFESQGGSRVGVGAEDDFELFGRTANVDTQTAGTSQWVRQALDRESNNFFEYVRNTIEEKTPDELGDDGDGDEPHAREGEGIAGRDARTVTFQELFDEERNSAMVAAQAFYHVLCLATKHRVWVVQDRGADDDVFGGEIRIGVF
ncbi:Meiotic recombination protein rec8 [Lachnellula arida]|uniref:Meiotic recombination protein rec8 n=1 Tax=Lachnellula arida TaxID=1316785 RepID=A0A8T9B3D1_9HELO|nr:Meiotic recombination protein rec8 [Lachnellula arida]